MVFIQEVDPIGPAVAAVAQEAVARRGEETFEAVQLELQLRALEAVAGPVDADIAAAFELVVGLVILDLSPVGWRAKV